MSKVIGLFPTPLMKTDGFLSSDLLQQFIARAESLNRNANTATDLLSHTQLISPEQDEAYRHLTELVAPHLVNFGELLFAEKLQWFVKEMWMNVLDHGGNQFMHTHANSFISGIIYITKPHPSTSTIFRKNTGGGEFIFKNDVPLNHYSSDTWMLPEVEPGDMVLYPSYLLHGVPPNEGGKRITIAFNAIPHQLDSLGYKIRFAP
ncbi:MAG: TIGR02466 family protein [Candidatus Competibacteraceae bacterium]|jgi:uncharacterized protein (TIGR02466 family)|nr:TIGR02466 family protein [Candidatus Competibacteraceae bacterium]